MAVVERMAPRGRYAPTASDLLALREQYTALLNAAIALSRLAKRLDPGGSLDDAVVHVNASMAAVDNYRAWVL